MKLSAPVTKELSDQAAQMVRDSFMVDLTSWIGENTDRTPDTRNPVIRFHLSCFADSCIRLAKKESKLDGRSWSNSLSLPGESVESALRQFNEERVATATQLRAKADEALQSESYLGAYIALMSSLFHEAGRFVSGNAVNAESFAAARKLLQIISMSSDEMVITGKPGASPRNKNTLRVGVDSIPLSGMALRATLPDGRLIFKGITNVHGEFSLSDITIPFVPKGTFLYISPDLGATVGVPVSFGPKHLGVGLPDMQYVLIFNIVSSTYTLKYAVNSASTIDVSQHDFGNSRFLEKYLVDSCFMRQHTGAELSDFAMEIECRLATYAPKDRDDDVMKVEAKIVFQPLKQGERIERQLVIHETSFHRGAAPPVGLFLWESANRLKRTVKGLLSEQ